jgi:hypothetical protein
MEEHVYNEIVKVLDNLEYISPGAPQKNDSKETVFKAQIADLDREIDNLLNKVSGANDILMQYINNRVSELDIRKRELSGKLIQISNANMPDKMEKITGYVSKWDELNIEDKKKVVDILINVIYIGDDTIEIEWNI